MTSIQETKDILEDYNIVFQQIAHMLINETWSYRFWVTYDFTLTLDGETRNLSGKGVGNFLDSLAANKD